MNLLNTILEFILPTRCMSCNKDGVDLCLSCLSGTPPAERECARWIFPLYDYRHPTIKKALWLYKYKGKKGLAKVFADVLYGRIIEELSELSILENFCDALLIPIPLSRGRRRKRGYNQAELICRTLVKLDENVNFELMCSVLIKSKKTKHQAQIENRKERLNNIVGSFTLTDKDRITGRNIILIDDITTTGATLSEARKILKQSGAKKIVAFTVAH
jgi:competence protein ComFC